MLLIRLCRKTCDVSAFSPHYSRHRGRPLRETGFPTGLGDDLTVRFLVRRLPRERYPIGLGSAVLLGGERHKVSHNNHTAWLSPVKRYPMIAVEFARMNALTRHSKKSPYYYDYGL